MRLNFSLTGCLVGLATICASAAATAQEALPIIGRPTDGHMGFQPAATGLAAELHWLDDMVLVIMAGITVMVTVLIAIIVLRFNQRANKQARQFTHNSPLEITWTVVPIVILLFIGAFSLPVLFNQQEIPEADVTIKATGHQWYWSYEYPDHEFSFDAFMIGQGSNYVTDEIRAELEAEGYTADEFLLATDNAMVVPVGKIVVVQVTSADVIHSWTVPSFGVKQDGIPGRLAELWFNVEQEGVYFGQCSELCGKDHAYMPITVKAVSQEAYDAWLDGAIAEFAGTPRLGGVALAAAR